MSPFITPLPIRAPVTTARARNADEFKGWGHRGALAVGAAPLYLPAEPWVGGSQAGDTARRRGPCGGTRGSQAELAQSQLIGCLTFTAVQAEPEAMSAPGEVYGGPQRWTKGRLRGWHGARVSGAGARGLWLLLFLPGSAGLAALRHPPPQIRFPPPAPFADFSASPCFCCSVRSEGASVVKVEVVWHFVF